MLIPKIANRMVKLKLRLNQKAKNNSQGNPWRNYSLVAGVTVLLFVLSLSWIQMQTRKFKSQQESKLRQELAQQSATLKATLSQSPSQRAATLRQIAESNRLSRARHRARYLLGVDLLEQRQGAAALEVLEGLEKEYPLLAPQILFQKAQAYRLNQQDKKFEATLNYLQKNYPNSPVVGDALALLGEQNPEYKLQLINRFPEHPHTQKIARQILARNQENLPMLLLLAKYSRDAELNPVRDRLVLQYPAQLQPEDWEAIADGYWRAGENRKAADAYSLASSTPRNLYRAGRGFHLNGNLDSATRAYQRLLEEYHDAREAGLALLHLASISSGDEAVVYLETAIAKFPANAAQAYHAKAKIHDAFQKSTAANQARQKLLADYGDSATAADYRWQTAQILADTGNKQAAWQWMQPVLTAPPNSKFAPQALYWTGKWAKDLGQIEDAQTAWKRAIAFYPQSYWAWRSAVMLGWDVGDFSSLRQRNPELDFTPIYASLPMGSEALQELYFLGQYRDAWTLLQSEIEHPQQLSVNEQFTEGLLLLKLGQIRQGIKQILDLAERESPQDRQEWSALRKSPAYWHGLFPFPYRQEILQYSRQEKINPLLMISVMRKESTFAPEIDSAVGAVGLMQIVPPTAEWVAEQINLEHYTLTKPEDNIKIGSWYLAHNHQRYDNSSLLAVASYNAGTGNVNQWIARYDLADGDRFVAAIPFAETQDYVEGVFGNYWNYLRLYNPQLKAKINGLVAEVKAGN